MKVLDAELDQRPTDAKVKQLAEVRIRNLLCFEELESFNQTGTWKYKHPLIVHLSEHSRLEQFRRKDPQEFLRQFAACQGNIKRYTSYLKNPGRESKRKTDRQHLQRHQERALIFKSILESDQS